MVDEKQEEEDDLKPKHPPRLAPQGIRPFTIYRGHDETGPPPRGSIAVFDSKADFLKVHIKPHPENKTILTWDDGEKEEY